MLDRALSIEADAARALLANIKDIIGDDEEAAADAVEGETGLVEAIRDAVARVGELESLAEGLKAHTDTLYKRRKRLEEQAERIRSAVASAMEAGALKKLELDVATVSRKPVPPKATISNEADIPSKFWKPQAPKLDLKAVLDALKAKEDVPGASLSNGSETLAVRFQ